MSVLSRVINIYPKIYNRWEISCVEYEGKTKTEERNSQKRKENEYWENKKNRKEDLPCAFFYCCSF